ncbi:MAG: hypothetical protein JXA24_02420 [Proteobacteria bacterium]|nr:hypothetical protein [Pseudomonadota bacterium]
MDGPYGRRIFADAGKSLFALSAGNGAVAEPVVNDSKADKSSYAGEPSLFDRFICFMSGMAYTMGSEIDANGQCQVKGELMQRNYRGR